MTVRPAKTDQPGHMPSLIRVFTVSSVGSKGPKVSSCGQWRLIRLGGCPGWSVSSLGAHSFCWFCNVTAQLSLCVTPVHQNKVYIPTIKNDVSWQNQQNHLCAQQRLSLISLCLALYGWLRTQAFKRLISLGACPGWSESLLGTQVILLCFCLNRDRTEPTNDMHLKNLISLQPA